MSTRTPRGRTLALAAAVGVVAVAVVAAARWEQLATQLLNLRSEQATAVEKRHLAIKVRRPI